MRGAYPEGFPEWEVAEIEKFRVSNPALYKWRKTAHLVSENMSRPVGRAISVPFASLAKAGAQTLGLDDVSSSQGNSELRDWAPACAGEGKVAS